MPRREENQTIGEVIGLVLLGLGTLLFLALISYKPKDVPEWVPIISHSAPANHPAQNFIGPLGAIVAGLFYFLLGAASYLLAAVMLGYGGVKLLAPGLRLTSRSLWVIAFVISGACLAELQPMFLNDWTALMRIPGKGGWLGHWLGARLLLASLGPVGSRILLVSVYLTSLVLMTGVRPILMLRQLIATPGILLEKHRERQMERATERGRLELEEKKLLRETVRLEKQLRKRNIEPAAVEREIESDDSALRPAPQIIDTAMVTQPGVRGKAKPIPRQPVSFENYTLPDLELLDEIDAASRQAADPEELRDIQNTIIEKLAEFNIGVAPGDITKGPTITRYEVYPAKGVRVDKIVSLERDLARATSAERINILAPIPGKDTVGIEIANSRKVKVTLRELLETDDWHNSKARIPLALGKDVYGKTIIADLAQMPHCLVAGTTGSGKSVCINSIIASMLYRFTPEQMQFVMIDPKVVEMQVYENLPHLYAPVVTDPKKVLLALRRVIDEMEKRYKIFAKTGVRNITSFNARPKPKSQKELDEEAAAKPEEFDEIEDAPADGSVEQYLQSVTNIRVPREDDIIVPDQMSYIVVIIDELADLMQTAPADVESAIARITQMARAAGIHMIVATQTPRADVVTGVIKANIPSRIAFQVASKLDSRVILDENGADRLLGQGDMLYLPPGTSRMTRAQGVLVTDEEIHRLVDFCKAQSEPNFDQELHEKLLGTSKIEEEISEEDEELVQKCIEIMRQEKKASTSLFQRRLRLGYTRAARVVDILEQRGYVAAGEGAKPREILVDLDALV
ncbi:MAG: segregation ATPase FtsK/SpoIIIE, family [Chthoniobacter sp.]|jgi:S-DNA-T family DNA segregation ATPase FtsK/SpoIIIE|nr:segregation ATPase FtsK/SpoIIIE, family [Chthoniobacter sp.]